MVDLERNKLSTAETQALLAKMQDDWDRRDALDKIAALEARTNGAAAAQAPAAAQPSTPEAPKSDAGGFTRLQTLALQALGVVGTAPETLKHAQQAAELVRGVTAQMMAKPGTGFAEAVAAHVVPQAKAAEQKTKDAAARDAELAVYREPVTGGILGHVAAHFTRPILAAGARELGKAPTGDASTADVLKTLAVGFMTQRRESVKAAQAQAQAASPAPRPAEVTPAQAPAVAQWPVQADDATRRAWEAQTAAVQPVIGQRSGNTIPMDGQTQYVPSPAESGANGNGNGAKPAARSITFTYHPSPAESGANGNGNGAKPATTPAAGGKK